MLSKALPVAALAGAAMAACPLSVEIAGSDQHVVQVAVTNTGSEAVTVFKGNTVFSEHSTLDLLVDDAGTPYFRSFFFFFSSLPQGTRTNIMSRGQLASF